MEQHQWLNEWCIAHQNWERLTYSQQGEPGAWAKCRENAFHTKCARTTEAVDDGSGLPSDEETRQPSVLDRPMSSGGPVRLRAKEKPTVAEPSFTTVERPVDDQVKKKRRRKQRRTLARNPMVPRRRKRSRTRGQSLLARVDIERRNASRWSSTFTECQGQ